MSSARKSEIARDVIDARHKAERDGLAPSKVRAAARERVQWWAQKLQEEGFAGTEATISNWVRAESAGKEQTGDEARGRKKRKYD